MGKVTGFLQFDRQEQKYELAADRIRHFREFSLPPDTSDLKKQAARCMDCGVPYCHGPTGCPVHNEIPDWNDLVYQGDWREAARNLHSTNNFPEITGRICPAPCEEACTLNLEDIPVTIKLIEQAIADRAWEAGWIKPQPARTTTHKRIAIVGSGPAGLAAAQQLARIGHGVHVFEREPKAGGLLRYGIPDFKLEKHSIERRIEQMCAEGVRFHYNCNIASKDDVRALIAEHDALLLCCGAEHPRDPMIDGQALSGVHYAMPYLVQQNRRLGGEDIADETPIHAAGKHVIVVGGGDTASDCIGTAFRQGAVTVTQMDIRLRPPEREDKLMIWPYWPTKFRTSTSQAEGADREFSAATLAFEGEDGVLASVKCARVDAARRPIANTEFHLPADLAFLAIGFAGARREGLLQALDVECSSHGTVVANERDYKTSCDGVFAAGDMRRGQSLVVWAIREGRQAARAIDEFLMGASVLPL